MDIKDLQ